MESKHGNDFVTIKMLFVLAAVFFPLVETNAKFLLKPIATNSMKDNFLFKIDNAKWRKHVSEKAEKVLFSRVKYKNYTGVAAGRSFKEFDHSSLSSKFLGTLELLTSQFKWVRKLPKDTKFGCTCSNESDDFAMKVRNEFSEFLLQLRSNRNGIFE
ncbi:hypothetical protein OSTOST_05663 [Ostertagia ostertagi]